MTYAVPNRREAFMSACSNLKLSKSGGVPKPYKPAMLLAAILLVRKAGYADNLLTLRELTPVFDQVMAVVAPNSPGPSDRALPFRHLESDGVWQLVPDLGADPEVQRLLLVSASARQLVKHLMGVRFDDDVFAALTMDAGFVGKTISCVVSAYSDVFRLHGLADSNEALQQLLSWVFVDSSLVGVVSDQPKQTLLERCVEDWLESNWRQTPFCVERGWQLQHPYRQVMTPVNAIDLLAYSAREAKWWIIELKRQNSSDAVVGQISRYRSWIEQARQQPAGGVVLTDQVTTKLEHSVRGARDLELWRYDHAFALERLV